MGLNFTGAIAGLGHGLATLGQEGIAEQQRVAADQRLTDREQALASLNHGYRESEADDTSKREINQYDASTPAVITRATMEARDVTIPVQRARMQAESAVQDHHAAVEHGYRLSEGDAAEARRVVHNYVGEDGHPVIVYGDGHERRLAGTTRPTEAEDPNAVVHRYVNTDNHPVLVLRNGTEQVLPGTVRQTTRPDPLGMGDDDGTGGGNTGGSAPPPAAPTGRGGRPVLAVPRPAASGGDTPPVPGARRGADGQWYVTRQGHNFLVQGN